MTRLRRLWTDRVRGSARARDVSDAAGIALVGLVLLAAGLVGTSPVAAAPTGADRWWLAVPLLTICAVMLGKRRRPLLALLAGTAVFAADAMLGGSLGVLLGLLDLIYSAALYAGAAAVRRLEVLAGAVVVGGSAATFVGTGDPPQTVNVALTLFAVLGTPLWWARTVRQQAELAALATARAGDLQRLAALRETEVVRAERTRMARDLHDALAGNLSAIALHTEAALVAPPAPAPGLAPAPAPAAAPASAPGPALALARAGSTAGPLTTPAPTGAAPAGPPAETRERQALRAIRTASVAALQEMRSMILLLRTGGTGAEEVASPARLAGLGTLLDGARSGGLRVRAETAALPETLPTAVDQAAYRIIQEALTNAAKHSPGAAVTVRVGVADDALHLSVVSAGPAGPGGPGRPAPAEPRRPWLADGDANPSAPAAGVGLLTMRERAEGLGGTFEAGWEPSGDAPLRWRVRAILPLDGAR
ncbi:histidine kinase [Georgenia sp. TF02-10]|uniref:sensor histidine kinase n=1 Tax=Georgenia sp. TF02-10 TaxID=2917725 RepID=UPI001FA76E5E|nr:histidine kinase [Georgenia sp. TF02-10]UNX55161.1 histidine kinase [Georgenia sp. TF02-10]